MDKDCYCSSSITVSFCAYFKIVDVTKCQINKSNCPSGKLSISPLRYQIVVGVIEREKCIGVVVTREYPSTSAL